MWKPKRGFAFDSIVSLPVWQLRPRSFSRHFYSEERLAEWVFTIAKLRPLQLNLDFCERSEEVRDTLLHQFHRWPESKIAQAAERCNVLSRQAEKECQEQVQLHLQELCGKLLGGGKALFWLNVLEPLIHPASVPREEVREILLALLEELKDIDGVYEQLMEKNERIWAALTLPLEIEPLFQGVSTLALCGYRYDIAVQDAMEIMATFADRLTSPDPKNLPLGLSVVASVGTIVPVDTSSLSHLSQTFREKLADPLAVMFCKWKSIVEEVLDVLEKSLTAKWTLYEVSPFKEELKTAVQSDLQSSFQRLNHVLATSQLCAVGKEERLADVECLNIKILRERELLCVQLNPWM
ncbi:RxLR effector protein [Phytophthora megakarya]|uniref:RxLR effector protein n=1 Tax=Phytophthora megakarya TaxID=4795 RepID=A0A225X309_9STRA|nr:RxLR effector protein [Phytophthora megakarya]